MAIWKCCVCEKTEKGPAHELLSSGWRAYEIFEMSVVHIDKLEAHTCPEHPRMKDEIIRDFFDDRNWDAEVIDEEVVRRAARRQRKRPKMARKG